MIRQVLSRVAVLAALTSSTLAQKSQAHGGMSGGSSSGGGHAPEIDVALAGAAIALVLGGILVFTTARRRKLARS